MKVRLVFAGAASSLLLLTSMTAGFPGPDPSRLSRLAKSQDFTAGRVSSAARNGGNLDTVDIPAGGAEVTLAELRGPGAITHLWTTFRGNGRDLVLRMYWEGNPHPSVEAPIGDFFGVAMGVNAEMVSEPIQATSAGRARNCWWRMPFNTSARVTASNIAPEGRLIKLYYYLDYARFDKPVDDLNYFHVRFRETDPTERGRPVLVAEAQGEGHFVGVVLGHRSRTPGWFGEGDDIITVDGKVAFAGTGTEDYFCDAWGFRTFSSPSYGVPLYEGREPGSRLSAYRFHIEDPIPFKQTFRFELEHWPWASPTANSGREYYSSTSFWYQRRVHAPWPRLETIVSHAPWDPSRGRWHVPNALEAEDLGLLGFRSTAVEPVETPPAPVDPDASTGVIVRALLRYGPRPRSVFVMPNFSNDHILTFDGGGEGGEFTLAVPVAAPGIRAVRIHYVPAESHGIVQLFVNGREAGPPTDTFLKTDELTRPLWPPRARVVENVELHAGLNAFRFLVIGKNRESLGYRTAVDSLVVEPDLESPVPAAERR